MILYCLISKICYLIILNCFYIGFIIYKLFLLKVYKCFKFNFRILCLDFFFEFYVYVLYLCFFVSIVIVEEMLVIIKDNWWI